MYCRDHCFEASCAEAGDVRGGICGEGVPGESLFVVVVDGSCGGDEPVLAPGCEFHGGECVSDIFLKGFIIIHSSKSSDINTPDEFS